MTTSPDTDPLAGSRRSLATGISARIEEMILAGDLKPGQRINESHLGAALRVSRAPVREACRRLERHGLVLTKPNRGTFVCRLDEQDVADLYDLRIALEELVGRRAATRIGADRLGELHDVLERLRAIAAAGGSRDYYRVNLRFHDIIVAAAGSEHIADAYHGVTKRLAIHRIGSVASPADLAASLAEHEAIAAALAAHDAAAAGQALAEHCRRGHRRHLGRSAPGAA